MEKKSYDITRISAFPLCLLPRLDRNGLPQDRLQMYPGDVLLLPKADKFQEGRILAEESTSIHLQHEGRLLVCLCFQGLEKKHKPI